MSKGSVAPRSAPRRQLKAVSPSPTLPVSVDVQDTMNRFADHLMIAEMALDGVRAAGIERGHYDDAIVMFLQELQAEFKAIQMQLTATAQMAG